MMYDWIGIAGLLLASAAWLAWNAARIPRPWSFGARWGMVCGVLGLVVGACSALGAYWLTA